MTEFDGRKAVVTGATRGIGRAITRAFLQQGAAVTGIYGGDAAAADHLRAECRGYGDRLFLEQLDVTDYGAVERFFLRYEERHQRLDILVNNAGIRRDALLPLMKMEDWQRVLDVNLTGGFIMSRFAVPLMMQHKYGRILFITSPMGKMGFVGQANYSASKAGQVGLMKSLAREVAKRRITVNAVSPGFIDTGFIDDLSEDQLREYRKMVPMRRFGEAAEVADAVLFLAGERAGYITGSVLDITGGL